MKIIKPEYEKLGVPRQMERAGLTQLHPCKKILRLVDPVMNQQDCINIIIGCRDHIVKNMQQRVGG